MKPLCFVLMPFGLKRDPAGGPEINFDHIYTKAIEPAIRMAELEPVRADHEVVGGIIHKPMFERLLLCEFAVADLTTANPNVFYELGVRHATRPFTTLPIFAKGQSIPFDVQLVRALPYELAAGNEFGPEQATSLCASLASRLRELKKQTADQGATDSPLLQLVTGYKVPELSHLRTDLRPGALVYAETMKRKLSGTRALPGDERLPRLAAIERELGDLAGVEPAVVLELFLAYRSVDAYREMLALLGRMPANQQRTVRVREQRAFALNRLASKAAPEQREALRGEAQEVLEHLIREIGPNPETYGLLGRIYKDRWEEAITSAPDEAESWLDHAIDAYRLGFEADFRDPYPGINAATLLEIRGSDGALHDRDRILPVVRFAAERRVRDRAGNYWDYATLLECAHLAMDAEDARKQLGHSLTRASSSWEPETTARNLRLIESARKQRGVETSEISAARTKLEQKGAQLRGATA
jgi:hypothetical protein